MCYPKRNLWSGAGIVEEVRYKEFEVEWMARLLLKSHVPVDLSHRVLVKRRFLYVQYLGALESDLLEQGVPLDEGFAKSLIIATARNTVRPTGHEFGRVL